MLKIENIGFVGGDTATFEFDFGTKVAGSVAECPLKLYVSTPDSESLPDLTGKIRTEENNNSIVYSGTWAAESNSSFSGQNAKYSSTSGSYFEYTFVGTSISVFDIASVNRGKVEVFIDGVSKGKFDAYTAALTFNHKLCEFTNLSYSTHIIRAVILNEKNASSTGYILEFDYLEVGGLWGEIADQTIFDKVKLQDDNIHSMNATVNNKTRAYMLELDLTPLCNALFGGNNAAMKTALKAILLDVWASGSGNNANINTSGVGVALWSNDTNSWKGYMDGWNTWKNTTSPITKISPDTSGVTNKINSANKLYVLIAALYPSNVTIASIVNLDYVKITVQFSRVPDIVKPITLSLTKTWAILLKNIAPIWNSSENPERGFITLTKDSQNSLVLYKASNSSYIKVWDILNESLNAVNLNVDGYNKYQIMNILLEQTSTGIRITIQLNNGKLYKYEKTSGWTPMQPGDYSLYIGRDTYASNSQMDAYIDSVIYYPNKNFTDAEAQTTLLGLQDGLSKNPNLFDINKVTLHTNAQLIDTDGDGINDAISLNATANYQASVIFENVFPNNQYELQFKTNNTGAYIAIREYYNNILLKTTNYLPTAANIMNINQIIVSSNTNKIQIYLGNVTTGILLYSNISFKLKM